MAALARLASVAVAAALAPCGCTEKPARASVAEGAGIRLDGRLVLAREEPGAEWRLVGRDPGGTRYSPLARITASNASTLREVWSWTTGNARGHEAAPLVVGG